MQYQAVADLYETNRKVLDKNPAPGFWHYLALSYMELRRPETAVAVWERHGEIRIKPRSGCWAWGGLTK